MIISGRGLIIITFTMVSPITEEFELQPLGADLPEDIDYDLEYLVRKR